MKHLLKFGFFLFFGTILLSCGDENVDSKTDEVLTYKVEKIDARDLVITAKQGTYDLTFTVTKPGSEEISQLVIKENGRDILNTNFSIDPATRYYKVFTADAVRAKAKNLASEFNNTATLTNVESMIVELFTRISKENDATPELKAVNNIFFHKSILATTVRSIEENKPDCECTVHPGYLLDKTNFHCQEDYFYNKEKLIEVINEYKVEHGSLDTKEQNLLTFLENTNQESIRFDQQYSFSVSNEVFKESMDNLKMAAKADCAWWCPLGCGSSHGCCGNYEGCCLYANLGCYIHDKMCTTCEPEWFCLPGCKPDKKKAVD